MAKHHTVQDKYLTQWRKSETENQLNIYVIEENEYIERGPKWKGFWRDDFNILNEEDGKSYLPEDVTSTIDSKAISVIKKVDPIGMTQLKGEDRSALAFYVALQYIRTPRYREESDKMVQSATQYYMRKDISSPDKVSLTKEELLKHKPVNKIEEEIIEQISKMSKDEIKAQVFDTIHNEDTIAGLTNSGHSKIILKVGQFAKEIFELQWMFLVAPKGATFLTSDNPCFTISLSNIMKGLLSPNSTIIFPLRPDLCIYIKPSMKSKTEYYMQLDDSQIQDINTLIISNSYESVVGKDLAYLKYMNDKYDYQSHKKSRNVVVSEKGQYTMFNLE